MMRQIVGWSRSLRRGRSKWALILVPLAFAAKAWATSPSGLTFQTLAFGVAEDGISEHMQINRNPNRTVAPWQLQLQAQQETDYHLLHLALSPGGHSGWHSHPGLLIGAVQSGQIDFYDANCQKRTVTAGEVYTENDAVHAISNTGTEEAHVYITFLVKHGAPRRRDEPAPECAVSTGIP